MEKELSRRTFLRTALAAGAAALAPKGLEAFAGETETRKRIVIDPGHGLGNRKKDLYDPGAAYDKVQEAHVVLDQAKSLKSILEQRGYEVILTRDDHETNNSLSNRSTFANNKKADFFVSLHCNAAENKKAHGVRTYHNPNSAEGKKFGRAIQDELVNHLDNTVPTFTQGYDGLREATFSVLRKTHMPAILVESGFLSNDTDRAYLEKNTKEVAEGIAKGIIAYLEGPNALPLTTKPATRPTTQPTKRPAAEPEFKTYTIQKGDTLWGISRELDIPVSRLKDHNPGLDPHALQIGHNLRYKE